MHKKDKDCKDNEPVTYYAEQNPKSHEVIAEPLSRELVRAGNWVKRELRKVIDKLTDDPDWHD